MQSTPPTTGNKDRYKISNWKQYNKALCQRGSLTLWVSEALLEQWEQIDISKKEVGKTLYPDSIITCCLLLKMCYGLKFRQATGFISSLLGLLGKGHLTIPDYSTLCRRQGFVPVEVSKRLNNGEQIDVAIDSTGLKVYGEGEWKVRKHGVSKRRTWRKLHLGIDVQTQEIICVSLTSNSEDDAAEASKMLAGKIDRLRSFRGDGAFDDFHFRKVLGTDVIQIIPPPKDAVIKKGTKKKPLPDYLAQRNAAVSFIKAQGSKEWKIQNGYHKRSLNEVVMFRYKTIFGSEMSAKRIINQQAEAKLKCYILNKFTEMGMPVSQKVAV